MLERMTYRFDLLQMKIFLHCQRTVG